MTDTLLQPEQPAQFVPLPTKRKHPVLLVLGLILLCLIALIGALTVAFAILPGFRRISLGFIAQVFGQKASTDFNQAFDQFLSRLSAWVTDTVNNIAQLLHELSARFQDLHLDYAFNDLMVTMFGPDAPTTDKIASMLPTWPPTSDPVNNIMIVLLAVCIPLMIVLFVVIRRRDAAIKRGEIQYKHHRRWWVWLLTLVALVATLSTAGLALLHSAPGWLAVSIGLLGFTSTTFRADI